MRRLRDVAYPILLIATIGVATPVTGAIDDRSAQRTAASASAENGPDDAADVSLAGNAWPCRVTASIDLQPFVQRAWDGSPTFREQCKKLAAAGALVFLRSSSAPGFWGAAARIGRSSEGLMVAHVRIRLGGNTVGLIAHELEHVLERIEGVKHLMEARRSGSSVSMMGGAFETQRAVDAGRRVTGEVEAATRGPEQARK